MTTSLYVTTFGTKFKCVVQPGRVRTLVERRPWPNRGDKLVRLQVPTLVMIQSALDAFVFGYQGDVSRLTRKSQVVPLCGAYTSYSGWCFGEAVQRIRDGELSPADAFWLTTTADWTELLSPMTFSKRGVSVARACCNIMESSMIMPQSYREPRVDI